MCYLIEYEATYKLNLTPYIHEIIITDIYLLPRILEISAAAAAELCVALGRSCRLFFVADPSALDEHELFSMNAGYLKNSSR